MKMSAIFILLALCAVYAPAQVLQDSAQVSLTTTGTTTITSYGSGTGGTLGEVTCKLQVNELETAAAAVLKVSLDGGVHTTSYTIVQANGLASAIVPFSIMPAFNISNGGDVDDLYAFRLPMMGVDYNTSGLTVSVDVTTAASSSGYLYCSVLHT